MSRSEHPIHYRRAVTAYLGCVLAGLALSTILGWTVAPDWPLWMQYLIGLVIGCTSVVVAARYLRWWYRPAPERTQWTEDRL